MNTFDFITSLAPIVVGLMMKFSVKNDGWDTPFNKYWYLFVIGGLISLFYDIYKYNL